MYKIFTKVIKNRIKDILDTNQPREQAGFRAGFSTTDHLQAINQLIEKANEYQLQLCLGFVDYQKAFDSIEHIYMFDALRKINIEVGYVSILEHIYTNALARGNNKLANIAILCSHIYKSKKKLRQTPT